MLSGIIDVVKDTFKNSSLFISILISLITFSLFYNYNYDIVNPIVNSMFKINYEFVKIIRVYVVAVCKILLPIFIHVHIRTNRTGMNDNFKIICLEIKNAINPYVCLLFLLSYILIIIEYPQNTEVILNEFSCIFVFSVVISFCLSYLLFEIDDKAKDLSEILLTLTRTLSFFAYIIFIMNKLPVFLTIK